MSAEDGLLEDFLAGRVEPQAFGHRQHLAVAFAMLRRHDFATAAQRYCEGIRALAARAGHPEVFNVTVTIAFLALVAERLGSEDSDFEAFAMRHPELFDRRLLERWYPKDQLRSDLARRTFVLPAAGQTPAP
ncbi:MAG: hypothetical protein JSS29_19830 [Proteobacteria bacterium]|nr:hypothetical protein [Pseudomonadota bacterium]